MCTFYYPEEGRGASSITRIAECDSVRTCHGSSRASRAHGSRCGAERALPSSARRAHASRPQLSAKSREKALEYIDEFYALTPSRSESSGPSARTAAADARRRGSGLYLSPGHALDLATAGAMRAESGDEVQRPGLLDDHAHDSDEKHGLEEGLAEKPSEAGLADFTARAAHGQTPNCVG